MFKKIPLILAILIVVAASLPGLALAQEPTGDFEVVRSRIETWLAGKPKAVITADEIFENMNDGDTSNDPFILSVRKPEDYAKGHVPGAANILWNQIAKPENLAKLPKDQPIVDYCYTGHTGQVAMTALNLLGYQANNMKFGMMGWTKNDEVLAQPRFDPAKVADYRLETEPHEAVESYDFPALDTGVQGEAEIVRTAIDNYLSSGKAPTISAQELFDNLNDGDTGNDPFILSVRDPKDYAKGHIPGAVNIFWTDLAKPENLAKLPPDRPIVVYCYTGHTGQLATTLLNVLGYDATNLKFGMMGWTKDLDVVAVPIYDPAKAPDYKVEGDLANAPAPAAAAPAESPAALPATGGVPFSATWVLLLVVGSGLLGSGLYLRRK